MGSHFHSSQRRIYFPEANGGFTVQSLLLSSYHPDIGEARWLSGWALDSRPEVPSSKPHDRCVVSLRKTLLPSQSTGNTQEEVAPSQHDWKIVYRDVKLQLKQSKQKHPDMAEILLKKDVKSTNFDSLAPKCLIWNCKKYFYSMMTVFMDCSLAIF